MSAILSADTLNDFIAPSLACIKPVEPLPPPPPPQSNELSVSVDDGTTSAPADTKTQAQISLTDCLACSGCVTSSEAILVQLQSHNEVLDVLSNAPHKKFIALLSPQSRAALAVALGATEREAGNMVSQLLKELGFTAVVDTNAFRQIELHFAAQEVLAAVEDPERKRPVLASSCPGFICYLETTHPDLIPHLSRLKSPQAIGGTFLKSLLLGEGTVDFPEDVYIVSVMPCFDKKLEGARSELTSSAWLSNDNSSSPTRDIDCAITTREVLLLSTARSIDLRSLPRTPAPFPPLSKNTTITTLLSTPPSNGPTDAGTSGGNLSHILTALLSRHPGASVKSQPGRNPDTTDYVLTSAGTGELIATLSRSYGFRNIQNLVRRLKPPKARVLPMAARRPVARRAAAGESRAVYVEVMACPGGCTNGGGQIKYDDAEVWGEATPGSQKELLRRVDEAYYSDDEEEAAAAAVGVEDVMAEWKRITRIPDDGVLVATSFRKVANDVGKKLGEQEVLELASRDGGGW